MGPIHTVLGTFLEVVKSAKVGDASGREHIASEFFRCLEAMNV